MFKPGPIVATVLAIFLATVFETNSLVMTRSVRSGATRATTQQQR